MKTANSPNHLSEVAKVFLRLGCVGFGGPLVHIAMMEEELVRKRQWMGHEHFIDLIGATNLIPGPNSTEMAMHCGNERAGWKGLVIAGLCFIMPAVIITGAFAILYKQYGSLPQVQPFLYGIKPAIIAVIFSLMLKLGKKTLKSVQLAVIAGIAAGLALWGYNEIYVLFGCGLLGVAWHLITNRKNGLNSFYLLPLQAGGIPSSLFNWKLFWIFFKTGSILFGSGYVLFAFLDAELVSTHLLTQKQLVDAIAVGQFTPGPVFSSATFIGWQIAGLGGAVAATVGIFLPSFLFVAFLNPFIPKLRQSKTMAAFLDTVNMVSVALILVVCLQMGKSAITDGRTILIAAMGFLATVFFKRLNTAFIILGGALMGYLLSLV